MAGQMDAEEWSQIMNRFFQILSNGVERFEGFVDKFTGDGIMVLSARRSRTRTTRSERATPRSIYGMKSAATPPR